MREARAVPGPPARALSDDPRLRARLRIRSRPSAARKLNPCYPEATWSKRRTPRPIAIPPGRFRTSAANRLPIPGLGKGQYPRAEGAGHDRRQ